ALAARLRDAVAAARLKDNPPLALPGMPSDGDPSVATYVTALDGDLPALLDETAARVQAAVAAESEVRLSSAELYATRSARGFRNSRGAQSAGRGTRIALDLVLIAGEGESAAEMHGDFTRRRLADLDIGAIVRLYAAYARHSRRAVTPATHRGPVILSGQALANLFHHSLSPLAEDPFHFQASAAAAHRHLSRFTVGAPISGDTPRGDRLTLISDPLRSFGVQSYACDRDGLPARALTVIEHGLFTGPWADARYAAYIGVVPTGAFANPTVTPGETTLSALRAADPDEPVYEIAAFSGLDPDPVSGDFVAEIKLGYRHDASGTHPIKGGSLAGNAFAAFADARFSREVYTDGVYAGPAAIRFAQLTISGD
ncbi:MAG: metallopeptidase TldD-related protein, partial [Ktedonobacterales bacterium]